ncbi:MAG TPA: phosphoribosyltransferase family protein [Gemmatimonadales bacterium]|nr:phosphoribosyltransferase family protein [Gemmatimonadales bacterium]
MFSTDPSGLAALERWLLPGACLLCDEATGPGDPLICALCRRRWRRLPEPRCGRCAQPRRLDLPCRICRDWSEGLEWVRSGVWLDDGARRTVHALKYDGWWRVTDAMVEPMAAEVAGTGEWLVVPVPLSPRRRRRRGYNQAARLAEALARRMGWQWRDDLLHRIRETPTQTALTPQARAANLAGAFRAESGAGDRRVLLVDDVFTTGATLIAAAVALELAGAVAVAGVTFARALEPLAG